MRFSLVLIFIYLPSLHFYDEDNIGKDITFYLHTRDHSHFEILRVDSPHLNATSFDGSRPSKVLIHGYLDDVMRSSNWMDAVKGLLYHGDYNVIIVDWFKVSINFYAEAVYDAELVAKKVADLMNYLKKYGGADFGDFHLIGHSLGAQISGFVGNHIKNIGRITGLDPAGPKFQNVPPDRHLDKSDANFVDVIHTDMANTALVGFGTTEVVGHADFFPNGGNNQAFCRTLLNLRQSSPRGFFRQLVCDHVRALSYFITSIRWCSITGVRCKDWKSFERGQCAGCDKKGNCAPMGFNLDPQQIDLDAGNNSFYLKVSDDPPFCSYQYRVSLALSQPKNRSIGISGMYLHLHGADGELFKALIRGFSTLRGNITDTYLLISEEDLGKIERLTFLWVNDLHNPLGRRRKRKRRLHVKEIRVSSLQLRGEEKKRFCTHRTRGIPSNEETAFRTC